MYKYEGICCCECGRELKDQETIYIGGDEYICEDCRNAYYDCCEDCGKLVPDGDIIAVDDNNRFVCEDCSNDYYACDHCGGLFSDCYLAVNTVPLTLCDYCYGYHYFTCADCGEVYYHEDGEYVDDCCYCRDCADNYRNCILPYSAKPSPMFLGEGVGYYGLELEIDNGEDKQDAARDIQAAGGDHIYIKEDGSLSCDGMEIVTHPATLEYHVNHFPWTDICEAALSYGYRSHGTDTCGLHIHASRSLFGETQIEQDLTIAKIMLLFDRWYDTKIVRFARRSLANMRRWADKPNAGIRPEDDDGTAISKSKKDANNRYRAINLCNRRTVEFRLFKGTLKRDTIVASIQWTDTLIKYCRKTPLKDLFNTTWDDIFANTDHVELTAYLKQRNLIKEGN